MRYHLLDVFTDTAFGGNQLAVFPDGAAVDPALMHPIARELNLSETVFVLPPDDPAAAVARLRIFTPGGELPFAGHPTVGTACLLAALGTVPLDDAGTARFVFEETVGPVPVRVWRGATGRFGAQLSAAQAPEIRNVDLDADVVARLVSLSRDDIVAAGECAPRAASCGVPFLFIPVRDRDALRRARIDMAVWERELAGTWAPDVYLYTFDAEHPGSQVRARMFAPGMGITEDPATGGAATALAALLARQAGGDGTHRWRVEQGCEMGRPSLLELEADVEGGRIVATRVGGNAVLVGEGALHVP